MQNDYRADDGRLDRNAERPRAEALPLTDREVPIENARTPAAIHAWLDGELPESAVQGAEMARDVEFWKRLGAETEQLRLRQAPAQLQANIMAAIAAEAPLSASAWQRSLTVTPAALVVGGTVLLALGAAIAAVVLRMAH